MPTLLQRSAKKLFAVIVVCLIAATVVTNVVYARQIQLYWTGTDVDGVSTWISCGSSAGPSLASEVKIGTEY
jgi:hypothetical protein